MHKVGKVFKRLQQFEIYARFGTGMIFITIGFYFSLKYIFIFSDIFFDLLIDKFQIVGYFCKYTQGEKSE